MSSESVRSPSAGVLLFALGIFIFAVSDALGKWIMVAATSQQILFVRSLGAALVLGPLAWREPHRLKLRGQLGLHGLRIGCMTADSFCFYLATRTLPLADVMTFYLAAPLIITALSVPALGERVGRFRWAAVLVGFVGVLIALRPSGASVSFGALVALSGAVMFAGAITTTRKLRDTDWLGLIVWQFVGGGLVGLLASPIGWVPLHGMTPVLMAVVGVLSMAAFVCITNALKIADASAVAPLTYTSIVWAGLLGWVIWGDVPDRNTAVGIVVIVASGLVVWWRERGRAPTAAEAVPIP